jgi:hypothetical protein
MNFDDDTIALSLVIFITIAFVVAAIQQGEIIELATGSIQFAIGAIAGYMSRKNKALSPELLAKIRKLIEENKQLKQALQQRRSPHYPGEENL